MRGPLEWTLKAAKAEEAVQLAAASSATAQAITKLDSEKFATAKQITSLEQDCGYPLGALLGGGRGGARAAEGVHHTSPSLTADSTALEQSLRSLKEELAALQARSQNVEADALKDVPSLRYASAPVCARIDAPLSIVPTDANTPIRLHPRAHLPPPPMTATCVTCTKTSPTFVGTTTATK